MKYEIERIKYSTLYTDPYPHLVIDDFFSPETYNGILKYFPTVDEMAKSAEFSRQIDIVPDPGVTRAANGEWDYRKWLTGSKRQFWGTFKNTYFSGTFVKALRLKFGFERSDCYACGRLAVEGIGAGLGPHTDREDKMISMVVYLDDNPDAKGTYLLKAKDPNFVAEERHYGYSDFDVVKTIDYKPNRLIAWKVVPDSYHSYYQDVDTERRTLKYFIQKTQDKEKLQKRIEATKVYAGDWRKDVDKVAS